MELLDENKRPVSDAQVEAQQIPIQKTGTRTPMPEAKGKVWTDLEKEYGDDSEGIANYLNNTPSYKAAEKTKAGMAARGYVQGEDGKWAKNEPESAPLDAPLGATYADRINNGTASDDDIRQSYEDYKNGKYDPSPEILEEYKKMGLITPQEEQAQQTENTEEVQEEVATKSDEELEQWYNEVEESLKPDEKQKLAGIFGAYKEGAIDKNQRNFFLADAIARFANNIGNIITTNNQNALWANIESGNQKQAEIDLSPNEWQKYLMTDWGEAQKLKNDAKREKTMGMIKNDIELQRQKGLDKYLYDDLPNIVKASDRMKLNDEERVAVENTIALAKGAPYDTDQLGNMFDPIGNAKLGNMLGDAELSNKLLGNQLQNAQLFAQEITNRVQNEFAEKFANQQYRTAEEAINALKKDNTMKDLLNAAQSLENKFNDKTFNSRVTKEAAEATNNLYGNAGVKLNIAGQEVVIPVSAVINGGNQVYNAIKSAMGSSK